MVYKVLSIIASILFALMTPVFVVCLVYSFAQPAVQAGIDSVHTALDSAVNQATQAMETTWNFDLSGLVGGSADAASGTGSATGTAAGTGSAGSGVGGSGVTAQGFADAAQGQAYLAWKEVVGDPVGRIFDGTGVTSSLLEGVAGGSVSAEGLLAGLNETALGTIASNASNYGATVAASSVPASLPEAVRVQMWQANAAAQSFAASVQTIVSAVRGIASGNLGSYGDLARAADATITALRTFDGCTAEAERLLGAA